MSTSTTQPPKEDTLESLASLLSTIVIVLFALTFILQNFVIPSSSMASTLLVGRVPHPSRTLRSWSPLSLLNGVKVGGIQNAPGTKSLQSLSSLFFSIR